MDYTARVELDAPVPTARAAQEDRADQLVEALAPYGGAIGRTLANRWELIFTVPAADVRQAASTAVAVATDLAGVPVYALEVLPADEHDRRLGVTPVPELLSVAEAAEALGVSEAAVRKRIDRPNPTIHAVRIGKGWAVPRSEIYRLKNAQIPAGRAPSYRYDG